MSALEMPLYRCHKEVRALPIAAIEFAEDGSAKIAAAGYGIAQTNAEYRAKFRGSGKDLGYYVVYADGYESWSPTIAFEEGYARI